MDITNTNYDGKSSKDKETVKVICLGDSAVGKSKLLERFLMDGYQHQQLSTFALTMYKYKTTINNKEVSVGENLVHRLLIHPIVLQPLDTLFSAAHFLQVSTTSHLMTSKGYSYHWMSPNSYDFWCPVFAWLLSEAHAAILVFDATRKVTYKNLPNWYQELREHRPEIPCFCAVNKIDENMDVTNRNFAFADKNKLKLYFVSAAQGTNVVKLFGDAIEAAVAYKAEASDFIDQVLMELGETTS